MNFLRLLLILFICCGAAWAQAPKESSETIRQLLSAPAPPPGIAENSAEQKQPRPSNFFDKDKAPADNAPIEDLFDYWPAGPTPPLNILPPIPSGNIC